MIPPTYPEDHLPTQIEAALAAAGWIVQLRDQTDLGAGLGVAVRKFSSAAEPLDYALFIDGALCGVIAPKPAGAASSGFADEAAPDGQARFAYIASGTELLFRDHADPAPRA